MKPFIKWAGGKRWLTERRDFKVPKYSGRYIEPFVGGGAVFFHQRPRTAIIADTNQRLIETYKTIAVNPDAVQKELRRYQGVHSLEHYYEERSRKRRVPVKRAAQFLYLNRTCWNGLYRENLNGDFNVPIGTKTTIYDDKEDFRSIAQALQSATILCQDFANTLAMAGDGDFVFIDPPYTTAHNLNGFVKYNQKIFSWADQLRLREAAILAKERGATICITNAHHKSIQDLYRGAEEIVVLDRRSVISSSAHGRKSTAELLIRL